MILLLLLAVLALWTIAFRFKRRRMYKLASLVPGPKGELPIIGNAHSLIGNTEEIMSSLQRFCYESMEHNGILKLWLNHILYFIIVNPVDLEMILKTCLEKDELHRFLRKVLGNGSIFAPVPIWRQRRKITVPAFSPKIVEGFVDVFAEESQKLTELLAKHANNGPFSIWPYLNSYSFDAVGQTTMGVKLNCLEEANFPVLQGMNRLLNLVCERIFHLWLQPDWLYRLFPQYFEHQKYRKIIFDFTGEVIKRKRIELQNELQSKPDTDNAGEHYDLKSYRRKTFLDLLISLSGGKAGYTDIELREELLVIAFAGTDTSAVATGYTLKLLSKYPDVQRKVYEELYEVFGDSQRILVKEDLSKLKYLERVIKESLRLFPPVPFLIRKVLVDVKLPSGYTLPAGSGVVVPIWGVHRDPKYWGPDAESFDPDRFLPQRMSLQHTCSYMPFSSGPRNCLGYQYSIMSVKTVLSTILRRYRVVSEEEQSSIPHMRVKLDIMMKDVEGYRVALEERHYNTI